MKFTELLKLVEGAMTASEVVGPNDEGRSKRLRKVRAELHPDLHTGTDKVQAEHAFARLEELLHNEKTHVAATVHAKFDITTKKRAYLVDGLAYTGTVANLYNVRYERGGKEKRGLLKVARSPRDGDLITAESNVLNAVWKAKDEHGNPDTRIPFFPRPEETFVYRDAASSIDRRAIVQRRLKGFVSLEEIRGHFPSGLDPRDLAWIWRRGLAGISLAHSLGYVHGSLTPAHIIIHPEVHGVQLVGWGQSVEVGETVKLLGDKRSSYFPPEVLNKEPVSAATDIYTLNKVFGSMLQVGSIAYGRFQAFVSGCTFDRPAVRPQDALVLLGEYDELIENAFGPRKFREFPPFPGRTYESDTS